MINISLPAAIIYIYDILKLEHRLTSSEIFISSSKYRRKL